MLRVQITLLVVSILATTSLAKTPRRIRKAHPTAVAEAETRRTTKAIVVRKKPAAKAASAGRLPANTVVTVESEDGDGAWIKIRARVRRRKQVVGYVPRTAVTAPTTAAAVVTAEDDTSEEGFAAPAVNEPRKTTEVVVVRKKPGEKQAATGTLPAGTVVEVEGEKGRWLRVRAGKIKGYLARTTVTGPTPATDTSAIEDAPKVEPPTASTAPEAPSPRRWSTSRQPDQITSTALAVETTMASALRDKPAQAGASIVAIPQGARLEVVSEVPGWIRVREAQGQVGWIPRAHVSNGSAAVAITGSLEDTRPASVATRTEMPARQRARLAIRIDAGIGYRVLGMAFTSNGAAGLANYDASADATAAAVDVDVAMRPSRRLVVGLDTRLGASRSSPGLDYPGPSGPPGDIAFSTVDVDAGLRAGIRTRGIFEVCARLGVHYDSFITSDVENAGMLPRERLLGSTLGARVDIAPPRARITATVHVDALVLGNRRQTPGLEDGASSTARGVWAGVTARFQIARRFSLHGAYDFGRATTEWSGMSVRDPGVTSARRIDSTQLVQLGMSVEL